MDEGSRFRVFPLQEGAVTSHMLGTLESILLLSEPGKLTVDRASHMQPEPVHILRSKSIFPQE